MGRSLGPILRRELKNLEKGAHSRKSAMKALKSFVKDVDSNAIPLFLAQVSETKEKNRLASSPFGEHKISLYEVLACVHGPKIGPYMRIYCMILLAPKSSLVESVGRLFMFFGK